MENDSVKLNFDGQEYEVESMSENGKLTVKSLQFVEAKTVELSNQKAVYNAAKTQYITRLQIEINEADLEPLNNVTE